MRSSAKARYFNDLFRRSCLRGCADAADAHEPAPFDQEPQESGLRWETTAGAPSPAAAAGTSVARDTTAMSRGS